MLKAWNVTRESWASAKEKFEQNKKEEQSKRQHREKEVKSRQKSTLQPTIMKYVDVCKNYTLDFYETYCEDYVYIVCHMIYGLYENYFNDTWNMVHLSTNILILVTLCKQAVLLSNKEGNNDETIFLSSLVPPFLATELLFYLSGLKQTGPLIRMIIKIIHGIFGLILILAIAIVSFAGSFTIQFRRNRPPAYDGYSASLMSSFGNLFAIYDVETLNESSIPALTKLLIVVFEVLVVVVLLNLLIALMGDIFGKVQANAQAESTFGLAKLVVEYEGLMDPAIKEKYQDEWFPRWLYVLKKDVEDDSTDEVFKLEKKVDNLNKKVDDLKADLQSILNMLKEDRK